MIDSFSAGDPVINLSDTLAAWNSPQFEDVLKREISTLDPALLPLQKGLSHSSYVGNGKLGVVMLAARSSTSLVTVRAGLMYTGVDAGSCCADDPTPVIERAEYCEVQFDIDRATGAAVVTLVEER